MKRLFVFFISIGLFFVNIIQAEPVETTLNDYAFDFASIGYEIKFAGKTSYFSDELSANDYFDVRADGYTLRARADKLSRIGRKNFISYFNKNCRLFSRSECIIILSGEVELDENFRMIIWATSIEVYDRKTDSIIETFK